MRNFLCFHCLFFLFLARVTANGADEAMRMNALTSQGDLESAFSLSDRVDLIPFRFAARPTAITFERSPAGDPILARVLRHALLILPSAACASAA